MDDQRVLNKWEDTACLVEGHYQVPIPFADENLKFPDNRKMAVYRLESLGIRLNKDSSLLARYDAGIEDLKTKGFAEEVCSGSTNEGSNLVWYLPHHHVINVNKPEKMRIVFDCAAEFKGVSMNKRVLQGPDLTNKLIGVILRFRQDRVAAMGDVEAMYHQVRVIPEHRYVLRFMWWPGGDRTKQPSTYRMMSHLFRGVWSPRCARFALQLTAQQNKDDFSPDVVNAVLENFYVDDCLLSAANDQDATKLVTQVTELLARGGFRLTKWVSNSRGVINKIPTCERAKTVSLDPHDELPMERALGVHWDTDKDMFGIHVKTREPLVTKRGLLSIMSSTYDPLGMVCPVVLQAKKLFQSECRRGAAWDDALSDDTYQLWIKWLEELPHLLEFKVDRCIIPQVRSEVCRTEVHTFCDASQEAYGCVSYLRTVSRDGSIHTAFLMAKSRLAPLKTVTVPRLELMGAVMAVQVLLPGGGRVENQHR